MTQAARKPAASRSHLATLDGASGGAGTPTPSEREALCLAQLRKGEPPPGWISARAAEWGISHQQVSQQLAAAREILSASRTPTAAQVLAHELVVQAIELADQATHLALTPLERRDDDGADAIEALAKAREAQVKALERTATLKLRCSAGLLAIHRPKGPTTVLLPGGQAPPLTDGALR